MQAQFCCFIRAVPSPWKLLSSLRVAVAVWLVESSCVTVNMSSKEAIAKHTWVWPTIH